MRYRALAVLMVVISCVGVAAAQIVIEKNVGGKTVACGYSGLWGYLNDCGVQSDRYAYVFVGSISAITPVENDEKEIHITPEEVFLGEPATPTIVRTQQAACYPKLAVGDRWLFFLRKEKGKPIEFNYADDSRPLAEAKAQIKTLRRLQKMGDFGIVRGRVMQGPLNDGKAISGARVVARRDSDKLEFFATTGRDGRYEFPPLPPGKYTLVAHPIGSFRGDKEHAEVRGGACADITLSGSPEAQISGHVRHPDGSPAPDVWIVVMLVDGSWSTPDRTDASGYFHRDTLPRGEYVVGIYLAGQPELDYAGCEVPHVDPLPSMYYPGRRNRSGASVIKLAADEKRDNIDFVVPKH